MSAVLTRAGLFHTVDPAVEAELTTHLAGVHFSGRQQIFADGEPGDQLYIITCGMVKLARRCPDGRSHLMAIAGPSEMFGELSLCDPGPRTATATALTDVDALAMGREAFQAWIAAHPQIGEQLLRLLARRMRRTENDLSDLIFTDVAARIAKHLLRLSQKFGVQHNGVMHLTHNLTQEELAQLIGTSRETVNKVLADFAGHGWIRLDRQSMLIIDSDALIRRAHHAQHRIGVAAADQLRGTPAVAIGMGPLSI